MKRRFFRAFCLATSLLLATTALAAAPATVDHPLMLYAAPGSTELFSLEPSAGLTAIEWESVGGSDWILIEIERDGLPVRGYADRSHLSIRGEIPEAVHSDNADAAIGLNVFAAPAANAPLRGEVAQWDAVTVLQFDGAYIYVEYTDPATGLLNRGWMEDWAVSIDPNTYYGGRLPPSSPSTGTVCREKRCTTLTTLYSEPDTAWPTTLLVPENAVVRCYGELYCGFSIVEYNGNTGYIQTELLTDI